jgi:hypothetical protein
MSLLFGCIWSIGATSDTDSRTKFDELFREMLRGKHPEIQIPEIFGSKIDAGIPENGTVYDYFFEVIYFKKINYLAI